MQGVSKDHEKLGEFTKEYMGKFFDQVRFRAEGGARIFDQKTNIYCAFCKYESPKEQHTRIITVFFVIRKTKRTKPLYNYCVVWN